MNAPCEDVNGDVCRTALTWASEASLTSEELEQKADCGLVLHHSLCTLEAH